MPQPSNESRISNLEKEAMSLGARIEELSSDTAEELKAIRQEMKSSFKEIGDFLVKLDSNLENVKTAHKEDLSKLETRLDRIENLLLQMVQKQPGE